MKLASLIELSKRGERRGVAAHLVRNAPILSPSVLQGLAPSQGVCWCDWETPGAVAAESANASVTWSGSANETRYASKSIFCQCNFISAQPFAS